MNAFRYPVPAQSPLEGEQIIVQYGKEWIPVLLDIVLRLKNPSLWESPPDDLDEFIHDLSYALITEVPEASMPFIVGEIRYFAAESAVPDGWELCWGQELSRTTYAELFAVIDILYGEGNGETTFRAPNLRGSVPLGFTGGSPYYTGLSGGEATHALTAAENGAHSHNLLSTGGNTNLLRVGVGGTKDFASGGAAIQTTAVTQSSGSGTPHNNLPPFLVLVPAIYAGVL